MAQATSLSEAVALIHAHGEQRRMDETRLLVGIVGEPGAGKSTIASLLVAALGPTAALLPMDGYHLPQARLRELGRRDRMGAADTFDLPGFVDTLHALHLPFQNDGDPVLARGFDRTIEEPVPDAIAISPSFRTIVVEGNYLLHWPDAHALLDLTFFVDVEPELRRQRLIERHVRFGKTDVDATAWALGPDESNARLIRLSAGRADHVIRLP